MSRNRDLGWGIAAMGVFGVLFAVSRLFASPILARPTVTPFTLTTELYSPRNNPPNQPFRHQVLAVRSDGARSVTATIDGRVGLLAGETHRTILFPDGREVSIYRSIRAKVTWQHQDKVFADRAIARLVNPPPDCAISGWRFVGYETVGAWRVARLVAGWRLHTSGGNGWYVIEWDAPELGCTSLASKSYDPRPDGSRELSREQRFVSLKMGEPDPILFAVPTDYQEMRPSDATRLLAHKYGETLCGDQEKSLEDQDRAYFGTLRPNGRYWREALPAPERKR